MENEGLNCNECGIVYECQNLIKITLTVVIQFVNWFYSIKYLKNIQSQNHTSKS